MTGKASLHSFPADHSLCSRHTGRISLCVSSYEEMHCPFSPVLTPFTAASASVSGLYYSGHCRASLVTGQCILAAISLSLVGALPCLSGYADETHHSHLSSRSLLLRSIRVQQHRHSARYEIPSWLHGLELPQQCPSFLSRGDCTWLCLT